MKTTARKAQAKPAAPPLREFDAAEDLDSPEMIAAFINDALDYGDPAYISHALGVVARAIGMSKIAKDANLGRESLYKALSPDGNPTFSTVMKVIGAMGVKLSAETKAVKAGARAATSAPRRRAQAA